MRNLQKPRESRHTAPEGGRLGLMTIDQVAQELGLSKAYIYSLTSAKEIPFYKPRGGRIFFDASEVREWVKSHRVKDDAELEAVADAKYQELERKRKSVGSNSASA